MTRKDTILIAVVINAGLLAILFMTAVIYDTDRVMDPVEIGTTVAVQKQTQADPQAPLISAATSPGDEVDNVLKYYSAPSSQPIVIDTHPETVLPEHFAIQANAADEEETVVASSSETAGNYTEVTVKKGDVLEKIAKANKTTVSAIKKANNLQTEKLNIGQVLKIPTQQAKASEEKIAEAREESKPEAKNESESSQAVYHVVKSGDNPWKIAKQYGVKDEDLLRLNNLDEAKAKNLKIGDRLRVK